jgi:hypothetical protein
VSGVCPLSFWHPLLPGTLHHTPQPLPLQIAALGDLGYEHQALLDALADRVVPARLPEFSLDHLRELQDNLNKLGWAPAARSPLPALLSQTLVRQQITAERQTAFWQKHACCQTGVLAGAALGVGPAWLSPCCLPAPSCRYYNKSFNQMLQQAVQDRKRGREGEALAA